MRYYLFLWLCLAQWLLFSACSNEHTIVPANEYVEAYTTGMVSRFSTIHTVFNEDIPNDNQLAANLERAFSIVPKIEGKVTLRENNTLLFTPKNGFDRDTDYRVKLDLGKLFGAEGDSRYFSYRFKTIAPEMGFAFNRMTMDLSPNSDTVYYLNGSILTADLAYPSVIKELIDFNQSVEVVWDESKHPLQRFNFRIKLKQAPVRETTLRISVKPNKLGYKSKELGEIYIPAKDQFTVYAIEAVDNADSDEHLRITFTRLLDPNQDFTGLVELNRGEEFVYTVVDNRLNIWPKDKSLREVEVQVHDGIRSFSGRVLAHEKVSNPKNFRRKLTLSRKAPMLEFAGNGGILPLAGGTHIPFFATSLRGVIVRVIKVSQRNIGQFLQVNNLDGSSELARVGELVARKLIFLDELGNYDLTERNAFAIDLKELIAVEPGAIYRVILSYNYNLSAYPSEEIPKPAKVRLMEEEKIRAKEEMDAFATGASYYYFSDQDWRGYNWAERMMPTKYSYYMDTQIGKNILSTNLGIIAKRGDFGKLFISINNLSTGEPEEGVSVSVFDFKRKLIERRTTWETGITEIILDGRTPYYVIAEKGEERGYLRLDPAQSLSISNFDVAGEVVQRGLKGYIYADRGVWRPSDTIFVNFILNMAEELIPANHPVTFELYNPSGMLFHKKTQNRSKNYFYSFPVATPADAATGLWRAKVTVGGASFEKKLRIETIKPNRVGIDLLSEINPLVRNLPTRLHLSARWLTGAVAQGMRFDVTGTFIPMRTEFTGYKGYQFDDPTRKFDAENLLITKGVTDYKGIASPEITMRIGALAPGMLRGEFVTKVYEESGEFSTVSNQVTYSPYDAYAGILSPQIGEKALQTGAEHLFQIASLSNLGVALPNRELELEIFRLEWYWWWSADAGKIADYISSSYNKPLKKVRIRTNERGVYKLPLSFDDEDWGTYLIRVSDLESGHASGVMAYFDIANEFRDSSGNADKAMLLKFTTNKESYKPGEEIVIRFPSTAESRAIVTIEGRDGVLEHHVIPCTKRETVYKIKATANMQPNVYVGITLLNPYQATLHDLPIRMYGVMPVRVIDAQSRLEPVIEMPEEVKPNSRLTVKVSEKNRLPMTYTIALVDEGLLDLTRFKTPTPWEAFNAKEALGVRTWDMYNFVLGAYGGKIEQLFSIGGDDALGKGPKAIVNRFKPVVLFEGPITLQPGETRTMQFEIPNYVGRVRCMVVAGDKNSYGNAEKSVYVRQSAMVLGTLPRKLMPGDEIMVPATIISMQKEMGSVDLKMETSDLFEVVGPNQQSIQIKQEGTQVSWFKLKVKNLEGSGKVTIRATANGESSVWSEEIEVKSEQLPLFKTTAFQLKEGEKITEKFTSYGIKGSNTLSVESSTIELSNFKYHSEKLLNSRAELLENVVSRALPFIDLVKVVQLGPIDMQRIENSIQESIQLLRKYQMPDGGFSMWPGGSSTDGWSSIYAMLLLERASQSGYILPLGMRKKVTSYQMKLAREWTPIASPILSREKETQAFRLMVLAFSGKSEMGAMNRLREDQSLTACALSYLATAYAFAGRNSTAEDILEQAGAAEANESIVTLSNRMVCNVVLGKMVSASVLFDEIGKQFTSNTWFDSFEIARVIASSAYFLENTPASEQIMVNLENTMGQRAELKADKKSLIFYSLIDQHEGATTGLTLENKGTGTLFIQLMQGGIAPLTEVAASASGLSLHINYESMDSKPINPDKIVQGTNFKIRVMVKNMLPLPCKELLLTQLMPSGWEILNTRYMTERSVLQKIAYQDMRDSEVKSYIPILNPGESVEVSVMVNAAYAGEYFLPPTVCGAIYNHKVQVNSAGKRVTVVRE